MAAYIIIRGEKTLRLLYEAVLDILRELYLKHEDALIEFFRKCQEDYPLSEDAMFILEEKHLIDEHGNVPEQIRLIALSFYKKQRNSKILPV